MSIEPQMPVRQSCCCSCLSSIFRWFGHIITWIQEHTITPLRNALDRIRGIRREGMQIVVPERQLLPVIKETPPESPKTPEPTTPTPSPQGSPGRAKTPESQKIVVVEPATPPQTLPKPVAPEVQPGVMDRLRNIFN